jgi:hypothetical protein
VNRSPGIAGLIAVVSGGTFAYAAKDKQVTGGNVPNDKGDSGRPLAGENTPALVIAASLSLLGFTACSWVAAHQQQWNATVRVVEQRALEVASRVLLAAATDEADKGFKADFLDSVAAGLRENGTTVISSEDVEKIVQIWSPNDGTQWQALAGQLGQSQQTPLRVLERKMPLRSPNTSPRGSTTRRPQLGTTTALNRDCVSEKVVRVR